MSEDDFDEDFKLIGYVNKRHKRVIILLKVDLNKKLLFIIF